MRHLAILCIFMLAFCSYGQQKKKSSGWILGPSIGYQYQEKNFVKASLWATKDLDYAKYLRFDGGVNYTSEMGKAHFIPELGVSYYLSARVIWPYLKAELTPYTLSPKVGIDIMSLLNLGVGYGFELQQKKNLPAIKGFNVSATLSLPFTLNF